MVEVFGQNLKLSEQIKLQLLRQRRNLRRAQFVENDLKHGKRGFVKSLNR